MITIHPISSPPSEITCSDPGEVQYASRVSSDYGRFECESTVTYSCQQNYQLTSGSAFLTCGYNQEWFPDVRNVRCKLSLGKYSKFWWTTVRSLILRNGFSQIAS